MSFTDRKGSINKSSRHGSFQKHGSLGSNYDSVIDHIPNSVLERRASAKPMTGGDGKEFAQKLPNLAGSSLSDTIYAVAEMPIISPRKWLVGPYVFLFMSAYITAILVFTQYVYLRVQEEKFPNVTFNVSSKCDINTSDPLYKNQLSVQKEASMWQLYVGLMGGIPSIFSNLILGSFTDKFGRKFLFLLPCLGTFIRIALSALGIYFKYSLQFFLIGYAIEGTTGKMYTPLLVCFTYVADITPPKGKQRSFGIVIVELSTGIAFAVFGFISGYFIEGYGFFYPMLFSAVLMAMTTILVFFIPESFEKSKRREDASIFENVRTIYDLFFGAFNRGRRWMYNILIFIFTITMLTVFGRTSVESLYQLGAPFCWTPEYLGYFTALRSLLSQIVGMGLVKIMQMFASEEAIAMLGCVSFAVSFVVEGFAKSSIMLYIVPVIGCFGLLTVPMCRGLLSKLTRSDQQGTMLMCKIDDDSVITAGAREYTQIGAVFAAIAAMETTIDVVGGAVIANEIYSHTVSFYPGLIFFVFSGCNIISLILMGIYRFGSRRTLPYVDIRR